MRERERERKRERRFKFDKSTYTSKEDEKYNAALPLERHESARTPAAKSVPETELRGDYKVLLSLSLRGGDLVETSSCWKSDYY